MNDMRRQVEAQVEWMLNLRSRDIPTEVMERARWVMLDSVGCILNGLKGQKMPHDFSERLLKSSAAMVSTELYEGNRFSVGHPACHIVPILLEEARDRKLAYGELLRIFICAYETASRWGSTVRFTNDMLGHGTIMNSGAASVEGLIRGMPLQKFANYIMLCIALPEVSTWQSVFEGSTIHDHYPGLAALNAKIAVFMSDSDVVSSETLIRSIYSKVAGTQILDENLNVNTDSWFLTRNYFKVHTGCRFIHPFADAVGELMADGLRNDNIESIYVYTYKKAARLTSQEVTNVLAAKFSIPVSLAVLLAEGGLYPRDVEAAIGKAETAELAARIFVAEDEKYNSLLPDVRGGLVKVTKTDGNVIEREVFHARGDFDDPRGYSEEELVGKFKAITDGLIDAGAQNRLAEKILKSAASDMVDDVFGEYFEATK